MDILNLKYYTFVKGKFAGVDNVLVSATGYTGAGGVEIYFENEGDNAVKIWNAIFEAGAEVGIKPVGLGARDTLRLEKGYCLYGNDIDDFTTTLEAGLGWITKFSKEFTASSRVGTLYTLQSNLGILSTFSGRYLGSSLLKNTEHIAAKSLIILKRRPLK
jgi:glycine cleavage system aminomethyltransferase T